MKKSLFDVPAVAHLPEKLKRASETIEQLERELEAFETEPPYAPIVDNDAERTKAFWELWEKRVIPSRFSILIGEVLYQFRTSLDHMLEALILKDRGTPNKSTQFPISNTNPRPLVGVMLSGDA